MLMCCGYRKRWWVELGGQLCPQGICCSSAGESLAHVMYESVLWHLVAEHKVLRAVGCGVEQCRRDG